MLKSFRSALPILSCVVLGILIGVSGALYAIKRGKHRIFRTNMELALVDSQGHKVNVLPPGTLLVASEDIHRGEKVGWTACIPISFGTMHEANELVEHAGEKSDVEIALSAPTAVLPEVVK